ncbi:MAG: MoaD/ThiS family protein, partial [Candidatus Thermoplasmatota archaeon]
VVALHGFPPPRERVLDLPEGAVADDAPRALGIRPELVLVFRDQRPLPGDAPLWDGDSIRILRVVSGGSRSQSSMRLHACFTGG